MGRTTTSYLDPFNERANDSFFDQLPQHFGKDCVSYESSFYGALPDQEGTWESAIVSPRKTTKAEHAKLNKKNNNDKIKSEKRTTRDSSNVSTVSGRNHDTSNSLRSERTAASSSAAMKNPYRRVNSLPVQQQYCYSKKEQAGRRRNEDDGTDGTASLSSPDNSLNSSPGHGENNKKIKSVLQAWREREALQESLQDMEQPHSTSSSSRNTMNKSKKYTSSNQDVWADRDEKKWKVKKSTKKQHYDYKEEDDNDDDDVDDSYKLPHAFQVKSSSSSSSSKHPPGTPRRTNCKSSINNSSITEIRGSMTRKAAQKEERGSRSKEQDHHAKRERSLSLGRLQQKKEEQRAAAATADKKLGRMEMQGKEELSNSLPSMGYHGRRKGREERSSRGRVGRTRSDDEESVTTTSTARSRSSSLGRLAKSVKNKFRREKKVEASVDEDAMEEHTSTSLVNMGYHDDKSEKGITVRDKDETSSLYSSSKERSHSVGRLAKNKDRQREHTFDRSKKPQRSSSLGRLHEKTRSRPRESDDSSSRVSCGRRHENRKKEKSISANHLELPSSYAPLMTYSKGQKHTEKKPATSSMDEIFGCPAAVSQSKKTKQPSQGSINAIHGNKSALAAWKMREASKRSLQEPDVTRTKSISRASVSEGTERSRSPRWKPVDDADGIPSMFLSPKSCRKDKKKYSSSNAVPSSRKGGNLQPLGSIHENQHGDLPPAFRHLSPRSAKAVAGSQGEGYRRPQRQSIKRESLARYGG